jgi:uncharacterized repeat protein (TIGR01451 family)
VDAAGDLVVYSVTVANTGGATLGDVAPVDPLCSLVLESGDTDVDTALDAGESWGFGCTYTVTQDDVDAGSIVNTVTVSAAGPDGALTPVTASETLEATRTATMSVLKSADVASIDASANPITYVVRVINTGNVTLRAVTPTDPLCTLALTSGDDDVDTLLDVGEVWFFGCAYTTTQADIDAGSVHNTVTVAAEGPAGAITPVTSASTVVITHSASMSVAKTADVASVDGAGDQIAYTVTVANTGDVTLTSVIATDPLCAPTLTSGDTDSDGLLDVGETWTYGCTYTVNQSDIDAGSVQSTVTVAADEPDGAMTPVTASTSVEATRTATTSASKTADVTSVDAAGDAVNYTVTVANTGNVTLTSVAATDPLCTLTPTSGDADTDGRLDVGETWTYGCTYIATQADIDAGSIENTATIDADGPGGPVAPATAAETVTVARSAGMSVVKAADVASVDAAGDTITYTVTVANTGNTTLTSVTPTDPLCGLVLGSGDADSDSSLDVGETWVFGCTYTVTQADVDAGSIANTVTVGANGPGGALTSVTGSASVEVSQDGSLSVVKAADVESVDAAGDEIAYTVTVANTGNVTLTEVSPVDPLCELTLGSGDSNTNAGLDVGETWVFGCTYTVTQDDVDAGSVENTVSVGAVGPAGPLTAAAASATVEATQVSALTLVKSADVAFVQAAGDQIDFTVTVANTGNVTLSGVTANDPMCDLVLGSGDSNTDDLLDVDEVWVFGCTYTVTQGDIDAGSIQNTAVADADGPAGAVAAPTGTDTVEVTGPAGFTVAKAADVGSVDAAGDAIGFTVTVANTGDVPMESVAVVDPLCDLVLDRGDLDHDTALDVAETWVLSCRYVVTAGDVAHASVTNTVDVTADQVGAGGTLSRSAQVIVAVDAPASGSPAPAERTPRQGPLPFTGFDFRVLLLMAAGLTGAGMLLRSEHRRRKATK